MPVRGGLILPGGVGWRMNRIKSICRRSSRSQGSDGGGVVDELISPGHVSGIPQIQSHTKMSFYLKKSQSLLCLSPKSSLASSKSNSQLRVLCSPASCLFSCFHLLVWLLLRTLLVVLFSRLTMRRSHILAAIPMETFTHFKEWAQLPTAWIHLNIVQIYAVVLVTSIVVLKRLSQFCPNHVDCRFQPMLLWRCNFQQYSQGKWQLL